MGADEEGIEFVPGQTRHRRDPVAEEADLAAGPRLGDDENAHPRQLTEVTVDRPLGDLETSREIGCRDRPRTRTEDDDLRNEASSFHISENNEGH